MQEICHESACLMFFPDFSVNTQKLRKSFDEVKQALAAKTIKYSMLFPARLRVQDGGVHAVLHFAGGGLSMAEHPAALLMQCFHPHPDGH